MSNLITTKTPAEDVASILVALGLGSIGTDFFVFKEPDDQTLVRDNIATIYDSGQHRASAIDYTYEYPTVQVRVRHKGGDRRPGLRRAYMLMDALHGYVGTVGSIRYAVIRVVNGPLELGEDDRGRLSWTFNCEIHRTA